MSAVSRIAPGDWIAVGNNKALEAVVCTIRPGVMEVVYLDEHKTGLYWSSALTGSVKLMTATAGVPGNRPILQRKI